MLDNAGELTGDVDQTRGEEHTHRVLGGYKATLTSTLLFSTGCFYSSHPRTSDDRTSDEAKERALEVLADAGEPVAGQPASGERDLHETRVLAGYKAAVHNPRVGEEAKQHAQEVLAEHGEKA